MYAQLHRTSSQIAPQPAAPVTHAPIQQQFRRGMSDVRFDTDPAAGHRAASLGAEAFTRGSEIAFAPGRFRPGTADGRWLIAHELAHVAQQRGGDTGRFASPASLEAQADRAATAVLHGWPVPELSAAPPMTQHKVQLRDVGRGEQSGFARVPDLIDRLNQISAGLTFAMDDSGFLTATPIEGATLNEFDRQMQLYCGDATQTIPLRFTNRHGLLGDRIHGFHEGVFVDAWQSAYVDIDDLLASSDLGLETALVHFIRERQETHNYTRRIGTESLDAGEGSPHRPEFLHKHNLGLDAERALLRDFFGEPKIDFVDRDNRVYRNPVRGDTIRVHVREGHGAAESGIQAISIEVVLHGTHKVISADEYQQILEDERAKAAAAAVPPAAGAHAP